MAIILLAWCCVALVCVGFGLAAQRPFSRAQPICGEDMLSAFWIGWAVIITSLQLIHFFVPMTSALAVVICVLGAACFLWNVRHMRSLFSHLDRTQILVMIAFACFSVWLANQAMMALDVRDNADSGLYHLSSIRWAMEEKIVPGLGNLHGRLAFNSSHFLFLALLNAGSFHTVPSYHVANGLVLLALSAGIAISTTRIIKGHEVRSRDIFRILLIPIVLRLCLVHSADTSPDLSVFVLGLVIATMLSAMFLDREEGHGGREGVVVVLLACVGVTIKLSFVGLAVAAAIVAWLLVLKSGMAASSKRAPLLTSAFVAIVVLLPWMGRGVLLSGYPAYPSSVGGVKAEWRVPLDSVKNESDWARSWARAPGKRPEDVLGNWQWFKPWLGNMRYEGLRILMPCGMAMLSMLAIVFGGKRKLLKRSVFLVPAVVSLVFWFFTAPDLRFAGASFWYLGAGSVALAAHQWGVAGNHRIVRTILVLSCLVAVVMHMGYEVFVDPSPSEVFPLTPHAAMREFVTDSGLVLHVPADGSQCWDAPLPCTPYPRENLQLRKDGQLDSGFMLENTE